MRRRAPAPGQLDLFEADPAAAFDTFMAKRKAEPKDQKSQIATVEKPKARKPKEPSTRDDAVVTKAMLSEHMAIAKTKHLLINSLQTARLPGSAFQVAIYLVNTALNSDTGECFPSIQTITEKTGVPRGTVNEAIAALKEAGVMATRRARRRGSSNYYFSRYQAVAKSGKPDRSKSGNPDHEKSGNPDCLIMEGNHVSETMEKARCA